MTGDPSDPAERCTFQPRESAKQKIRKYPNSKTDKPQDAHLSENTFPPILLLLK